MVRRLLGLVVVLVAAPSLAQQEDPNGYCLTNDNFPYLFYSTKTSYEFVFEKKLQPSAESVPSCKPVQLWLLARHGTRYPSASDIKRFMDMTNIRDQIVLNRQSRHSSSLCFDDLTNIKDWRPSVSPDQAGMLTRQGYNDGFYLARRLKSKFSSLLDAAYSPARFTIAYSSKPRTRETAQAFVDGLFGPDSDVHFNQGFINDQLLMPNGNCTSWESKEDNPETVIEATKFRESPMMQLLVARVSQRMGFLYNLSFEAVQDMYNLCRYDKAWNYSAISPWCAAFEKADLQILEYYEDLKYYYKNGYGNQLTFKLGCPLVRDLLQGFELLAANVSEQQPSAKLYFTHSDALLATLVRLGMANDKKLITHKNYNEMSKRQWRTSFLSPFAGNLAVVFYKCSVGDENRLMFFINEHVVNYEGCDVGLCDYSYIRDRFESIVDPKVCNFDFCSRNPNGVSSNLPSTLLMLVGLLSFLVSIR